MIPDYLIWLGVAVLFGILEAATLGLTSIWFALGALAAMLCALAGWGTLLQLVAFVLVSLATLALVRKKIQGKFNITRQPTNADRILGRTALVTEVIDNTQALGAVKIDGVTWSARSISHDPIPLGAEVVIRSIEGVKVLVELA